MQLEVENFVLTLRNQISTHSINKGETLHIKAWKGVDDTWDNVAGIQIQVNCSFIIAGIQLIENNCNEHYVTIAKAVLNRIEGLMQDSGFVVVTDSYL